MRRDATQELAQWYDSPRRKPLVVSGARQVGKTWLVQDFAASRGPLAYVNLLDNRVMQEVFAGSLEPGRLLAAISAYTGVNASDGRTLVFLDEVQECPRALTALKMFCEQRPDIPIVVAGSLLGVALNRAGCSDEQARASWPVGKVDHLDLYPMTFVEFLEAMGEGGLASLVRNGSVDLVSAMGEKYEDLLRTYLYVGGMPAAVAAYTESRFLPDARDVQDCLLRDYEYDFSKHVTSPVETERIRETWRSVPAQIAREDSNGKFVYSQVRAGGRGRDYRDAVSWLVDAGLVTRVPRVSMPGMPLRSYADDRSFKLFMLDVGLLGAALHLPERAIIEGDKLFTHAKGAYAEQYVCQQLVACGGSAPYYWSADGKQSKAEIDFLYDYDGTVVPVEVKADRNVSSASLSKFAKEYGIERCVRLSLRGYEDQRWLVNMPLYAADMLVQSL